MSEAGRVIAGSARGIRLRAPGAGTRPLADRVKQTLFAILVGVVADRAGMTTAIWAVAAITAGSGVIVAVRMSETHPGRRRARS